MIQTAPVYSCSATHKDSALIHVKLEASLRSLLDRQYSETQLCSLLSTAHFTSALLVETYRQSELFRTTVQNENCRTTTQETYAWNISYVTPVKKRVKKGKMVPSTPWTYIGAVEMSLYSSTPLREMSGQPHTPEALPAKKENPLNGDWVGLTAGLYYFGETSLAPAGVRTLDHPTCRLGIMPTDLSRLPTSVHYRVIYTSNLLDDIKMRHKWRTPPLLLQNVRDRPGPTQPPAVQIRKAPPVVKRLRCQADHSTPSSAGVMNGES